MYLAENLSNKHPEWKRLQNRWRFYLDSYLGGEDYRRGQYLNRYMLESGDEYDRRVMGNALDNHARNVVHIYNSFLFSDPPSRTMGQLENDPSLSYFMEDADLEGRDFTSFMSYANLMASVFGHVWIFVDRPQSQARTRAEELAQGIRPYVSLVTPQYVMDWEYRRSTNGVPELQYIKLLDYKDADEVYFRIYYEDRMELVVHKDGDSTGRVVETIENPLGRIPAVCLYANRGPVRGVGISDISDIVDIQKNLYNLYSELSQLVELSNHPSLVKTNTTDASAGAGAIITMDESLDPGLKPYLLQPNGQSIDGILSIIAAQVQAIDRIAHLGGIRGTQSNVQSGVALQIERQLLNSKLTEKSSNLELAEEQIWRLWALWQGTVWDGTVDYPRTYNLRDATADLDFYIKAAAVNINSPTYAREVQKAIAAVVLDDQATAQVNAEIDGETIVFDTPLLMVDAQFEPHTMINPRTGSSEFAATQTQHLNLQARGYVHVDQLQGD